MQSGSFLEFNGTDDCTLYGAKGEMLAKVTPHSAAPRLRPGPNPIQFACEPTDGPAPRARVVVIVHGDPL
jgi:hypothetical protein